MLMFADLFDLNPAQITGIIATAFVGMLLMVRARRNMQTTQKNWEELRASQRAQRTATTPTANAAATKSANTKSTSDDDDDTTIYIPEYKTELQGAEARIHELERAACARIDTKIAVLQQLMIQTETAIHRLQGALESAEQVGLLDQNPMPRREVDQPLTSATVTTKGNELRKLRADTAQDRFTDAYSGRISLPPKLDEDPRFVRVYALADGGLSATKIATQTGMQIGEVELILSLRPKQRTNSR